MVNFLHVSSCRPCVSLQTKFRPARICFPVAVATLRVVSSSSSLSYQFNPLLMHRPSRVKSYRVVSPVCLTGDKDKSEGDGKGSSWNPSQKAMEGFKGQSVEDVLRQQMQKQEFYGGGSGQNPPPRGGGGGGDGDGAEEAAGGDGPDEAVQMILATIGFICLYIYILTGQELFLLAKDYFKYLFGSRPSARLRRAMNQWKYFIQRLKEKPPEPDELWLEKLIINTPTVYDSPEKYKRLLRSFSSDSGR